MAIANKGVKLGGSTLQHLNPDRSENRGACCDSNLSLAREPRPKALSV